MVLMRMVVLVIPLDCSAVLMEHVFPRVLSVMENLIAQQARTRQIVKQSQKRDQDDVNNINFGVRKPINAFGAIQCVPVNVVLMFVDVQKQLYQYVLVSDHIHHL